MRKISVLIPSRNEPHLVRTIQGVLERAEGEVEIVAVIDGPTDYPLPAEQTGVKTLRVEKAKGMRSSLTLAASAATGDYLMKLDAHCLLAEGWDSRLKSQCDGDWVVVSRRYDLDPLTWTKLISTRADYFWLGCPWIETRHDPMQPCHWLEKDKKKDDVLIDDLMTFSGSLWFTTTDHFRSIGGMSIEGWGEFAAEPQEIGLKTWLGGGRVVVNKETWYAHLRKVDGRPNHEWQRIVHAGMIYAAHYWAENRWAGRVRDFDWLIDKFWPLPTANDRTNSRRHHWPLNWRDWYEKRPGYGWREECQK